MMKLKHSNRLRNTVLALFLVLSATALAQHPKKAVKAYESAEAAFLIRDYKKAHQMVLKAVMEDPNYAKALLLEGEIGMETQDFDLAMLGYEQALGCDSMVFPPAAISLARLYDRQGSYNREIALLRWYQSKKFGSAPNDAIVAELLALATFRDYSVTHPVAFSPKTLGVAVNSADDEYVNMLSFDGSQLLFTRKEPTSDGYQKEFLFTTQWDGEQWLEPQQLSFSGFPDDVDAGAAFVSADGRKLFLTGCGWGRNGNCDLYLSEWTGTQWSKPRRLSETINTPSWESQPCVSGDGMELYFVSRRNGNADIYCSRRNADGSWGEPQNLGEPINTKGTEMAPFLHPDGRTLYFSSDKHIGMGGFDLFVSRR